MIATSNRTTRTPLLPRQGGMASTVASTTVAVSAEDLVLQAEEHFNVSGASVIAAWLLALILGVSLC